MRERARHPAAIAAAALLVGIAIGALGALALARLPGDPDRPAVRVASLRPPRRPPSPGPTTPALAPATPRPTRAQPPRPDAALARRLGLEDAVLRRTLRRTPLVSAGSPRRRVIALTFDDGPSPYTPQIIRVLERFHVPASFYVVGQQLTRYPGALREELRRGYAVGDHTENHAYLTRLASAGQLGQIRDAALRMRRLGVSGGPAMFRPPYGAYDAATLRLLRRMRMLMVLWSIDPGDWRRPGSDRIAVNVLSAARPGAIVLLHDGGGFRDQTVAALPRIIRGLKRRHFTLVTLPRLLQLDPPPLHQRRPRRVGG